MPHSSTSARARGPVKTRVTAASCSSTDVSPGILTAATLQCILSTPRSTEKERRRQRSSQQDHDDDAEGNAAAISPYDPRFTVATHKQASPAAAIPRRQTDVTRHRPSKAELRRKYYTKKLQPIAVSPPSPSIRHDSDSQHAVSSPAAARLMAIGNQTGSARDLHSEVQGLHKQHAQVRTDPDQALPKHEFDDKLQREIQWIHQHLPVLKLATAKCSLQLRQRLFATTSLSHFTRAELRSRWLKWKRVIAQEKQQELLQLRASHRIIRLFQDMSLGLIGTRFRYWRAWMAESQTQETLAACISIQRFYHNQRRQHEQQTALNLQQALEEMHEQARKIQRAFQTHIHVRALQISLRAARRIQATLRSYQLKQRRQREHIAALKIQRLGRRYLNRQQANLSAMVTNAYESHKARTIQLSWRSYAHWKHSTLPLVYIGLLVDQVEYLAAVAVIQSHATGFLCRRHVKKCHSAARRIQTCWRSFQRRECDQRMRKMEQLSQSTAACCLQRTFKRNRERVKFRRMMQRSARPMYLRACNCDREFAGDKGGDAACFRARYHVEIVKSAVSVIQSSWRKHVKYTVWKARRIAAATRLQRFLRRVVCMAKWHCVVYNTMENHHQQVRNAAVRQIQHCWRHFKSRQAENATAASLRLIQELAGFVRAAISIQRQFRRSKRDSWCVVAFRVLYEELPRRKAAVARIWKLWCAFHGRKQVLLTEFGQGDGVRNITRLRNGGGMDLASLKQLLVAQQLQFEREQDASSRIQRMFHRFVDKRNGKLLLQRYKIMMRQEMRKREQRKIIHGFLDERTKKQQQLLQEDAKRKKNGVVTSPGVHLSATTSGVASTSSGQGSSTTGSLEVDTIGGGGASLPTASSSTDNASEKAKDGQEDTAEQQQFWSDEYQRAYLYNARTGESVWL